MTISYDSANKQKQEKNIMQNSKAVSKIGVCKYFLA